MPYATGTIYKIICNVDSRFVYIGSTFNQLRHRFQNHKRQYKHWLTGSGNKCSCYDHFKRHGLENFTIVKIKQYVCWCENKKDKKHLHAYEQLWINNTPNCCNTSHAFQPVMREHRRQQDQKPAHKERRREYEENNPELIQSYSLARNVEITCDRCGCMVSKRNISRHQKSKTCMSFSN